MKLKPHLWPFFTLLSFISAQATYSGSLSSKYAESSNDFNFSEHFFDGQINLGSWSAWSQLEFSEPPELGVDFSGLRKFKLEYLGDNFSLEMGDVYTIWGRGLILNQVDDQAIDLDTGTRGLLLGYFHDSFTLNIITGKLRNWKSTPVVVDFNDRVPNYETDHFLTGAIIETENFGPRLGLSFLQSNENHFLPYGSNSEPENLDIRHNFAGGYSELSGELFDAFFEFAYRNTSGPPDYTYISHGFGLYAGIGTYVGDWSAVIDYKNYDFGRLSPDKNFDFVNNYDLSQDFQRPPTGVYLHTSRLIGRVLHELDLNDEVGSQIHITGPIKDWFTLSLIHSRASRHDVLSMNEQYVWNPQDKSRLIASDSPFSDYFRDTFIQIEGSLLGEKVHYKLAWDMLEDVLSILTNVETVDGKTKSYEMVSAQTFPLDLSIQLPSRFSLEIKAEYQSLMKGYKNDFGEGMEFRSLYPVDTKYNTVISIGIARSPKWSIAYTMDRTSQEWDKKTWEWGPKTWTSIELLYNLSQNIRISIMSGSQQGGLLCSNGVCRYVQDFDDGYKINMSWLF